MNQREYDYQRKQTYGNNKDRNTITFKFWNNDVHEF